MSKATRQDTREHLLAIGEQLCLQRGFTGMGLSELLSQAGVPKGSFYHYFRSKEAFGVALLERYFSTLHQETMRWFASRQEQPRERLLRYYQQAELRFRQSGHIENCLAVKISAEVCDLSEEMRLALERGAARQTELLAEVLRHAADQGAPPLSLEPEAMAQTLYSLWLGASLQSKIRRDGSALTHALAAILQLLSPG
ncbi:TetR/AcrR family transcriptional regulator [Mixta tenebrionis]|uniref:TetR/AcrR family transcriptional regulator n=1 Tax=Mixta tenebrionis TaxID=2562439 RepID=A0A506VDQ3_9GAMM|nr:MULTISPECIES: TetR/AcrR family transcriptional regulator [Mixta]QHM75617.1 HTH-type transcriptional repressor NemR [Mixta theicola]TPW44224.1 TetR/AcrR family transcriptional regulator [Mixta tenebrionis]